MRSISDIWVSFYKLVGDGETDERLDSGVECLKELIVVAREGFGGLGTKMDLTLEKQDKMIGKQDVMIEEVRGVRYDLKSYVESRFERIESEMADIKRALRQRGII
ncbi:MAG: hypothetical protein ACXQT4_02090 [Methanotrichaceae archaeon]